MIFVPKIVNNYTIERQQVEDIGRFYKITTEDGVSHLYPSMTTLLSHKGDPEYIAKWKERVGPDVAYAKTTGATEAGTLVHEFCEHVLLRNMDKAQELLKHPNQKARMMMKKILPYLRKITKVYASEEFLFSRKLRIAGTVDAACEYLGIPCILDFKTSHSAKLADEIQNYYIQACGYAQLWEYITGMRINKVLILLATPQMVQEFWVNVDDHYPAFLNVVREFYKMHPSN